MVTDRRFYPIASEPDEIRIEAPAHKVAEVERRLDARQAAGYGALSVADFEEGARTTTLAVEMANGRVLSLAVTYDPTVLTEAASQEAQDLAEDDDPLSGAELFCRLILDWQLYGPLTANVLARGEGDRIRYGENGRPVWERVEIVPAGTIVPLEPEIVQYVPNTIRLGIWRAIGKEIGGDPKANRHARRALRKR